MGRDFDPPTTRDNWGEQLNKVFENVSFRDFAADELGEYVRDLPTAEIIKLLTAKAKEERWPYLRFEYG